MRFPIVALLVSLPLLAAASPAATATLRDAQGKAVGTATLTPAEGGVKISVTVTGVSPGLHGFHVHAVGKCEGPDFKSAGGHFNPALEGARPREPEGLARR